MRAGVDIGGTFTDVVLFDEASGAVQLGKVLSTPAQLAAGVETGLRRAGAPLSETSVLIHGATVSRSTPASTNTSRSSRAS
jgi:N-methylhydantoinase A